MIFQTNLPFKAHKTNADFKYVTRGNATKVMAQDNGQKTEVQVFIDAITHGSRNETGDCL
jgi:hypothetical protein